MCLINTLCLHKIYKHGWKPILNYDNSVNSPAYMVFSTKFINAKRLQNSILNLTVCLDHAYISMIILL